MSTSPILELRGVSKSFGAVQALYQVDFHVAPGEVMALVGDNGAGKSTLIKCIAGIHPIDSGEIRFDGAEVHIHGPKDAAQLGIEVCQLEERTLLDYFGFHRPILSMFHGSVRMADNRTGNESTKWSRSRPAA